jgi:hypothetical protein
MLTIDQEAKQRIRHPLDFDNMSERYKTSSKHYTFTSPSLWVLEKHLFYLLKNSIQKDFDPKYKWKPDYLSFDEYGTVVLAPYLMFVNGVLIMEEFDLVSVIIPSKKSMSLDCLILS